MQPINQQLNAVAAAVSYTMQMTQTMKINIQRKKDHYTIIIGGSTTTVRIITSSYMHTRRRRITLHWQNTDTKSTEETK